MPKSRKGVEAERELAQILWDRGWAVIRGPASGAGVRKRFQPDIVAARNGLILVFEVKTVDQGKPVYLSRRKVENLVEWSRRAGGKPLIAVKILRKGWRIYSIEELVDAGSSLKLSNPAKGERLEAFLDKELNIVKTMDNYIGRK